MFLPRNCCVSFVGIFFGLGFPLLKHSPHFHRLRIHHLTCFGEWEKNSTNKEGGQTKRGPYIWRCHVDFMSPSRWFNGTRTPCSHCQGLPSWWMEFLEVADLGLEGNQINLDHYLLEVSMPIRSSTSTKLSMSTLLAHCPQICTSTWNGWSKITSTYTIWQKHISICPWSNSLGPPHIHSQTSFAHISKYLVVHLLP